MSYTATVDGSPIPVARVRVDLDTGRAPHVSASISVPINPATDATYEDLDPRALPRVVLSRDGRDFDLSVRDRRYDLGGVAELELASDEAILMKYRPSVDDRAPRALEGSLRDVIDYVLDTVIPGAALESSPANDADVTAYWALTNLVTNPSGYPGTQGYSAGPNCSTVDTRTGGHVGSTSVRWYSTAAGGCYLKAAAVAVQPGRMYYMSARIINTSARNLRIGMWFYDPDGGLISTYESDPVVVATGAFDLVETFVTPPPGTASAVPFALFGAGGAAETAAVDALMVVPSEEPVEYFQPGLTITGYTMSYESGGAGEGYAQATRTPDADLERAPESTVWRTGVSAYDFLLPLVQAAGFRLVCNEAREWTLRAADHSEPGSLTATFGHNLRDASERISLDSGLYFDARLTRYRDVVDGVEVVKDDYYELNTPPAVVDYLEIEGPFVGLGRSQYAVERAQSRGREVEITVATDMTVVAEQIINITLDDTVVQTGAAQRVSFVWDENTDEMQITTRTRETPTGAIELLEGTIAALTGNIEDL